MATAASPGQSEIAVAARQFGKARRRARRRRRKFDRNDQFARPQVGLEQTLEEILGLDLALAASAGQHQRRAERHRAGRKFGRRIGIGETAAERAAIADRDMADMRRRLATAAADACGPDRTRAVRACRVSAPSRTVPSACDCPRSSLRSAMSTSSFGADSRMLSPASRLWPPATATASPPASARIWQASASDTGRM